MGRSSKRCPACCFHHARSEALDMNGGPAASFQFDVCVNLVAWVHPATTMVEPIQAGTAEVRVAKLHQPPTIARLCTWVQAARASVQALNRRHLYSVGRRRRHAELSLAWVGYEDEVSESEAVDGTARADAGGDDRGVGGGRSGRGVHGRWFAQLVCQRRDRRLLGRH